jgi:hypothetical protein
MGARVAGARHVEELPPVFHHVAADTPPKAQSSRRLVADGAG